jgi:hypothetical protein
LYVSFKPASVSLEIRIRDVPLQQALFPYFSCPNPLIQLDTHPRFAPFWSRPVRSTPGHLALILTGQSGFGQSGAEGRMIMGTLKPECQLGSKEEGKQVKGRGIE